MGQKGITEVGNLLQWQQDGTNQKPTVVSNHYQTVDTV
jgi:hypothetical protein